ncbi:MAG: hypothetical protein LBI37_00250 [Puniceicoccales bacterium]|nr:hypothetical protein [Puniceicoccales bacterium]
MEIFRKFCENLQAIDPLNYLPAAIVTPETSDIDSIKMNLMEAGAGVLNCNFFSLKTLIEKIQPMPVGKYRSATPKDLAVICRHVIETLPSGSEKILLKSNIYEFLKAVDDITHMDCNFSILGNQRFVAVAQALETWMKKYNIFSAEDCLNNQVANITDGNPKMFQLMVFYGFSWTHIHKLKIIDRLQSLAMDSSFYCLYDESNDMEFFWLEPLEKIFGEAKYLHSQNENNMPSVKITHTETQLTEALLVLDEIEKIISSHPTAHLGIVAPSHKCLTINIIDSILSSRGVTYYSTSPSFIPPSQKLSILYAWATFQQYLMPTSLLAFMRQLLANHILELDEFNKIIGEFSRAFDHILSKNFSLLLAFISMDKTTRSVPFFEKYPLLPPQATFGDFLKLMEENFPKTIAPEDVKTVMTFKVPISRANFCTRLKEAIRDKRRKISTHRQNNSKIWLLTSQQAEKYTFSHLFIVAANEQTWLSQSENIFLGDELECQTAINRKKHFLDNLGNLSPNIFITDHDKNVLTNSISTHIFEADRDKTGPKSSYFERLYRRHPKPSKNQIDEFKYVHNLRWDETAKFGEYDYSLGQNQIGNFTISCKAIERAMTNSVSIWNETILV